MNAEPGAEKAHAEVEGGYMARMKESEARAEFDKQNAS